MHDSVMRWAEQYSAMCAAPVLEVGSQNINGTVRPYFPEPYVGVDIIEGEGVDKVYDGQTLPVDDNSQSTVICLEVFEHAADPVHLAGEIVRVLRTGGTALISARGVGFGYHNPPDRWRYMPGTLSELFSDLGCLTIEEPDPQCSGWFVLVTK